MLTHALITHGSVRVFSLCANRLPSVLYATIALIWVIDTDSYRNTEREDQMTLKK